MRTETEMLLMNIRGLCEQADREPEKAYACVSMIARTIAAGRRQTCEKCFRKISRMDKLRHTETGVEHKNCDWPKIGVTPEEYRASQGEQTYQQMKGCLFGL